MFPSVRYLPMQLVPLNLYYILLCKCTKLCAFMEKKTVQIFMELHTDIIYQVCRT